MYDAHGNVVGLADKNANKVVTYSYDAWGNITNSTGTVTTGDGQLLKDANPFRYSGYQYDDETGFYYLKSRYYNPEWGRFLTRDAVPSVNLYVYCANNPIIFIDPSGYMLILADGVVYNHHTGKAMIVEPSKVENKDIYKPSSEGTGNLVSMSIDTKSPPPKDTGYKPPKNPDKGKQRVRAPGGRGETGWLDKKGNVWVPDLDMDGGEGWRRHYPDRSHDHVYPGGKVRTHNADLTAGDVAKGAVTVGGGYLIYRGVRMLPSLLPPLWPTIPVNVAIP